MIVESPSSLRTLLRSKFLLVVAAVASTTPVGAETLLYSQPPVGPATNFSSWTSSGHGVAPFAEVYDDFVLEQDGHWSKVKWQGFLFNRNTLGTPTDTIENFRFYIYADQNGKPDRSNILYLYDLPLDMINQETAGLIDFFGNGQQHSVVNYTANLPFFRDLEGGKRYWISIVASTGDSSDLWTWSEGFGSGPDGSCWQFIDGLLQQRVEDRSLTLLNGDEDGDSLPDDWESAGGYLSGSHWVPLVNANPKRKDIFVYVAYMAGPLHSHKLSATAITSLEEAFRRSPINNLDGSLGISLHIESAAQPIREEPDIDGIGFKVDPNTGQAVYDEPFHRLKLASFPEKYEYSRFYCLMSHSIKDTDLFENVVGRAQILGRDFTVGLGSLIPKTSKTLSTQQAATFMHELGHTLGLLHGGFEDTPNKKPNYLSVMNYFFSLNGLIKDGKEGYLDYSRMTLPELDETNLDERFGLFNNSGTFRDALRNSGLSTRYYNQKFYQVLPKIYDAKSWDPIDWNGTKGLQGSISQDLNNDGTPNKMRGFDDWSHLNFSGSRLTFSGSQFSVTEPSISELLEIPPPSPSNVRLTENGVKLLLQWNRVIEIEDYTYRIYRQQANENPVLIGETTSTSFSSAKIRSDSDVRYTITAVNFAGRESAPSDAVQIGRRG